MASQPDKPAIVARDLRKRYGELEAVRGVSFTVAKGEIVGFLGPNGAGKTTTVRMLSCFLPPGAGSASIHGVDIRERPRDVKRMIGVCPQEGNLDPDFHVVQNLHVYGRYFGIPRKVIRDRALELLAFVALSDKAHAPVASRSGGMKRRLGLARALLNEPRDLIRAEATTGLDPQPGQGVWMRRTHIRAPRRTTV